MRCHGVSFVGSWKRYRRVSAVVESGDSAANSVVAVDAGGWEGATQPRFGFAMFRPVMFWSSSPRGGLLLEDAMLSQRSNGAW